MLTGQEVRVETIHLWQCWSLMESDTSHNNFGACKKWQLRGTLEVSHESEKLKF